MKNKKAFSAAIFGLMVVPIMAMAGIAFDFGRTHSARQAFGEALDASIYLYSNSQKVKYGIWEDSGTLQSSGFTVNEMKSVIIKQMELSGFENITPEIYLMSENGIVHTVAGRFFVDTIFLSVIGVSSIEVENSASAELLNSGKVIFR